MQRLAFKRAVDFAGFTLVGEDENVVSFGVCECYVFNAGQIGAGGEQARSAANCLGVVCEGPVLAAARYLPRLGVECDDAAAGEGADVGFAFFVENKVPSDDAARPVLENAGVGAGPLSPIGGVVRSVDERAALGPVGVLVRKGVVHPGHGVRGPDVAVPGNAVDEFKDTRIAEFILGASPKIVVVIKEPDFCVERGVAQGRPKKLSDEGDLVFLPPGSCGHAAVLVCVRLVLRGDGADGDASRLVGLNELDEVLRVGREVLLVHGAAEERVSGLHPGGRAPGGGEEEHFGVDAHRVAEGREDVGAIVVDGEVFQAGIGRRGVVIGVGVARVIAATDGGAADGETEAMGAEELVHECLALSGFHAAEEVAGGIGEGCAEPEDALKPFTSIHFDIGASAGSRLPGLDGQLLEAIAAGGDPGARFR